MKFFDFLEDYYRDDRICIKTLKCEDLYFLVRNRGTMIDETMLRKITKKEADGLKNKTLNPGLLYANSSEWFPLAWLEGMYTEEQLIRLKQKVEEHKKKEMTSNEDRDDLD